MATLFPALSGRPLIKQWVDTGRALDKAVTASQRGMQGRKAFAPGAAAALIKWALTVLLYTDRVQERVLSTS